MPKIKLISFFGSPVKFYFLQIGTMHLEQLRSSMQLQSDVINALASESENELLSKLGLIFQRGCFGERAFRH